MVFLKKIGLILNRIYQTLKHSLGFKTKNYKSRSQWYESVVKPLITKNKDKELLIAKEKELVLEMFDTYFLTEKLSPKEREYIQVWKDCFPKNEVLIETDKKYFQGLKEVRKFIEYSKNINNKNFISERQINTLGLVELDFYIDKLRVARENKSKIYKNND